jgi:signal transduction histidine kinase
VALCDAGKFRNMAGQLLDNAAKFTQNGKIEVIANRVPDKDDDLLVVDIIDTGIGIAPDQITHLFEKFTVADDSSTSKYGGTGLGLALSQKLCKLMGGEISVESALGKGSRFTVRMPLHAERRRTDTHAAATLVPDTSDHSLTPVGEAHHA